MGGAAQTKATKSVAGTLRLELAQFRELASFAQFASDLDEDTKKRIARGRLLTEVLKQKQYNPYSVSEQVIAITAATSGAFDHLLSHEVITAVHQLQTNIAKDNKQLVASLNSGKKPQEKDVETIVKAAKNVARSYGKEKVR